MAAILVHSLEHTFLQPKKPFKISGRLRQIHFYNVIRNNNSENLLSLYRLWLVTAVQQAVDGIMSLKAEAFGGMC